jgi:hypothetical protein
MNNVASMNPSLPAENARCSSANAWTTDAHLVGAHLAKLGTGRAIRHTKPGDLLGVLDDLVRRGMVARSRGAWYRITDAGLLAFPSKRCTLRWGGVPCSEPRGAECFELAACDVRPDAWARLFNHSEPCTPHRTPAEPFPSARRRVPVQVVRGPWGDRGGPTVCVESDMTAAESCGAPSMHWVLAHAPARELDGARHYMQGYWPGVGSTDPWPATRIGYPGHEVRRVYA